MTTERDGTKEDAAALIVEIIATETVEKEAIPETEIETGDMIEEMTEVGIMIDTTEVKHK